MFYGIVAVSKNGVIGRNGELPWKIPQDLRHFRELTMGNIVIMGRKTFESLPGKNGLRGRINIVITRGAATNPSAEATHGLIFTTMENLAQVLENILRCRGYEPFGFYGGGADIKTFIIGGSSIFDAFMSKIDTLYVTQVNKDVLGGDVFLEIPYDKFSSPPEKLREIYSEEENCEVEFLVYHRSASENFDI